MRLVFVTLYQRFRQRIYMMLNDATLYQRFKQGIYMMLNYATLYQGFKYIYRLFKKTLAFEFSSETPKIGIHNFPLVNWFKYISYCPHLCRPHPLGIWSSRGAGAKRVLFSHWDKGSSVEITFDCFFYYQYGVITDIINPFCIVVTMTP